MSAVYHPHLEYIREVDVHTVEVRQEVWDIFVSRYYVLYYLPLFYNISMAILDEILTLLQSHNHTLSSFLLELLRDEYLTHPLSRDIINHVREILDVLRHHPLILTPVTETGHVTYRDSLRTQNTERCNPLCKENS